MLVGNVAQLQSGLELLLGALPDDGLLDVAGARAVDPAVVGAAGAARGDPPGAG